MLKDIRQQRGLTQQALSAASGVNVRQIRMYESGACSSDNMTLKNAVAIADALGVDVRDLLDASAGKNRV